MKPATHKTNLGDEVESLHENLSKIRSLISVAASHHDLTELLPEVLSDYFYAVEECINAALEKSDVLLAHFFPKHKS